MFGTKFSVPLPNGQRILSLWDLMDVQVLNTLSRVAYPNQLYEKQIARYLLFPVNVSRFSQSDGKHAVRFSIISFYNTTFFHDQCMFIFQIPYKLFIFCFKYGT